MLWSLDAAFEAVQMIVAVEQSNLGMFAANAPGVWHWGRRRRVSRLRKIREKNDQDLLRLQALPLTLRLDQTPRPPLWR
jgi:hypothetical protein